MLDWMERRLGWLAFPSIIRYLALFQLGMVGMTFLNPGAAQLLSFHWPSICQGEVWRLVSFIFVPIGSLVGPMGSLSAFFAVMAAFLMMSFSDGIEERLGVFRTTVFFLSGWLICLLVSVLMCATGLGNLGLSKAGEMVTVVDILPPGILFDATILFAFATFHPRFTILLFFILPVQIWILAVFTGVLLLMNFPLGIGMVIYILLGLSNYLVLAMPALRQLSNRQARNLQRRIDDHHAASFHICADCGKTDKDEPNASFRVSHDGDELCLGCLADRKADQDAQE